MVHMQIISKFPESSHYTIFIQKHLKVNPVDSLEVFLCLSPSLALYKILMKRFSPLSWLVGVIE